MGLTSEVRQTGSDICIVLALQITQPESRQYLVMSGLMYVQALSLSVVASCRGVDRDNLRAFDPLTSNASRLSSIATSA
jgi:hypothetical protein